MKKHLTFLLLFLLTGIICLHTACEKKDLNAIIYYKAIGKGYIYDATNNKPLSGINIEICYRGVQNHFPLFPNSSGCGIVATVLTDKNGCYNVRFIEKHRSSSESIYSEIKECRIYVINQESGFPKWEIDYPNTSSSYFISVPSFDYLNEVEIFALDTIKFYKTNN